MEMRVGIAYREPYCRDGLITNDWLQLALNTKIPRTESISDTSACATGRYIARSSAWELMRRGGNDT